MHDILQSKQQEWILKTDMDTILILKKSEKNQLEYSIENACDKMEEIYRDGYYPGITVIRGWSEHNPEIGGAFTQPKIYKWYLKRELKRLLENDAEVHISREHKIADLSNPSLIEYIDEESADYTRKKLFLFPPERIDLSLNRLHHYTGTDPDYFQRYILFTNYDMHMEAFINLFPDCIHPERKGVQMPAYHHIGPEKSGFTIINIGVGPSNAKTITDHLAVLRPDAMVMVGHCGGLRNHQSIGDFVLATGHLRDDKLLDEAIPINIPIAPNLILNQLLVKALEEKETEYRVGTVYTTLDRNWELNLSRFITAFQKSRSIAIDMECATLATNGFRYRIPNATLLCISDRPLHGKPKLTGPAKEFYERSKAIHLKLVIHALTMVREKYPFGLPNDDIRAFNEPLMSG